MLLRCNNRFLGQSIFQPGCHSILVDMNVDSANASTNILSYIFTTNSNDRSDCPTGINPLDLVVAL